VDDSDPLEPDGRITLDDGVTVAPGENHVFSFTLQAPTTSGTYRTDWRMVHELVRWFGPTASKDVVVTYPERPRRSGPVHLEGRSLVDDGGAFHALGATLMWATWGYKNDRARLEENLAFLAAHGFDYIRVLGVVGDPQNPDFWDGREADWRWPDYDDVIAGLTDLAFDTSCAAATAELLDQPDRNAASRRVARSSVRMSRPDRPLSSTSRRKVRLKRRCRSPVTSSQRSVSVLPHRQLANDIKPMGSSSSSMSSGSGVPTGVVDDT
jgi:hypothetical protein